MIIGLVMGIPFCIYLLKDVHIRLVKSAGVTVVSDYSIVEANCVALHFGEVLFVSNFYYESYLL